MSEKVLSPEEFFGFPMGSDRHLARWDQIVEYFTRLTAQSEAIRVVNVGPTTEGHPFLLVIISSPTNLRHLDRLKEVNRKLSDPRGVPEDEVAALLREGRAVVCQSMSFHATEIGGAQMAPELAYDLLTGDSEEAQRIREEVIFLLIPCGNPDGQILVTDWYRQGLGTAYEGGPPPGLYHKYVGHDTCRDAFQTNMVESTYVASILFREWTPQVFLDHHQMGSYGARLFVPPYCEPLHPHADPLILREQSWYGHHMAYSLEEAGKTGVLTAAQYMAWHHLGPHALTRYHNIAGMHTESASAKLATPLYIHPSQLRGDRHGPLRGFAQYRPQTNFPHPWPGGWWRLRDIVEQQKIAAWATLDLAARFREKVLRNAYLKACRQTERGAHGTPRAYVIPRDQHDPLTALKLVDKLLVQGIEVHRSLQAFQGDGAGYPAGAFVVFLAQPKSGAVKTLLGRTAYPDTAWTRQPDGTPIRPSDTATDTMAEFMGVHVDAVNAWRGGAFEKIMGAPYPAGGLHGTSAEGYVVDGRLNDSYRAVNRVLAQGATVWRLTTAVTVGGRPFPSGAFLIQSVQPLVLDRVAKELHLDVYPLAEAVADTLPVRPLRVGLYQRFWGGNIDEGWTRWLLEQFEFPFRTIRDDDIKGPALHEALDVILLPNDSTALITGEGLDEEDLDHSAVYPPAYRSGIGQDGVAALKRFVEAGGTLITFNASCAFAIDAFGLHVRNVVENVSAKDFFCPGSTLRTRVSLDHPLGYGMPEESLVLFWDSPAFDILPSESNQRYEIIVHYPEREILKSGWLIGEEKLPRKAAMVAAHVGKGQVVLIGFRVQHRAQTHGTFKLLFNALLRQGSPRGLKGAPERA
jgi:hypothetical protein